MSKIVSVKASEILASDGQPTVKCTVFFESGSGSAAVSYGVSSGSHEATVFTDDDPGRFHGKGVLKVCETIEQEIAPHLIGKDVRDLKEIDNILLSLDETPQKEKLGGNAILAVSMASARAGAKACGVPLYEHIRNVFNVKHELSLPKPMVVTIEGGRHAYNSTDIQEYLLSVTFSESAKENVRVASEVYYTAKKVLKEQGWSVNVGNEGAFAPEGIKSNTTPLDILTKAIEDSGYKPGKDVWISLDAAATEFFSNDTYSFSAEEKVLSVKELSNWYEEISKRYPIFSIEDPFGEDSWSDWTEFTSKVGGQIAVVGDDLTVTNVARLTQAVEEKAINGILIKLNQAGSVSETVEACLYAKDHGLKVIPSHRGGGESNDTFLVDLGVAVGADFIKVGIARGERVVKYNRLMDIENQLRSSHKN